MMIRSRTSFLAMSLQKVFGAVSGPHTIQRTGPLETSPLGQARCTSAAMRAYVRVTCGLGLACLLAYLAGTAAGASAPKPRSCRASLDPAVTKEWKSGPHL